MSGHPVVFTRDIASGRLAQNLACQAARDRVYKWKEFTACTLCVWFVSLHIVRVIDVIAYCCSLFSLLYIILLHIHTTLYLFCSWWIFCVVFLFPLGVCLFVYKISGKDLFKGLRVCKLRAQLGKTPEVFQRRK